MDNDITITDKDIESVGGSTMYYIKKKYLFHILFVSFIFLLFAILSKFPGFIFFPLLFFPFLYASVRENIMHFFMQDFAMTNSYKYQKMGLIKEIKAPYLQMDGYRYIEDVVSGIYNNCPMRLFNFNCIIGSGKNTQHIIFTVCEIQYKTNLPRIILDSQPNIWTRDLAIEEFDIKDEEIISLEGDFNKYFTLYVPKGYEIEALQIFAPDVMAKLIDKAKMFSLEFLEDHLYIYSHHVIEKKSDLYSLYELAKILIEELAPVLERLK